MQVQEFLETYPVNAEAPVDKSDVYTAAREEAHLIGQATLNVMQGLPQTPEQLAAFSRKSFSVAGTVFEATETWDDTVREEYMHFNFLTMSTVLRTQLALLDPSTVTNPNFNFNTASQFSAANASLNGLELAGVWESERQKGRALRYVQREPHYNAWSGLANEYDTVIALLGLARSLRTERSLVLLAAPPQVEWYSPLKRGDQNRHADFLLIDTTDPNNRKIACVQAKTVVGEETAEAYDTDKVVLVCGQSDLGNWTSEDGRIRSTPGWISLQKAKELLLNRQNFIRAVQQGHIDRADAVNAGLRFNKVLSDMKGKQNTSYKEIYAKLWPRLEKALDS